MSVSETVNERCGELGAFACGPVTCQLKLGHSGNHVAWQYAANQSGYRHEWSPTIVLIEAGRATC